MARRARRYDFYLPLTFNDGESIPRSKFVAIENRLLDRFGGITAQKRAFPFRGIWQGQARRYLDQVIIITALDFRVGGSARFILELKKSLLDEFDQEEILITEAALRVH